MNSRMRDHALRVLMEGGSYREALDTAEVMGALDAAPNIKLHVPIRFRKRYEDMKNERGQTNEGRTD